MEANQHTLMKHFSSVLRKRCQENNPLLGGISTELTRYLSRKELLEIITQKYEGSVPKTLDLLTMENQELLEHIADELFVISYVTLKWSREAQKLSEEQDQQQDAPNEIASNQIQEQKQVSKQTNKTVKTATTVAQTTKSPVASVSKTSKQHRDTQTSEPTVAATKTSKTNPVKSSTNSKS